MPFRRYSAPETPAGGVRVESTPAHHNVLLPSPHPRSVHSSRLSDLSQQPRRPPYGASPPAAHYSSSGAATSRFPPPQQQQQQRPPTSPPTAALAHLAPHSPAVARASRGGVARQSSASMRGTPAAQRTHSANYASRLSTGATPSRPQGSAARRSDAPSPPSATAGHGPAYYVVGNAVVNPLLTVSPSVQQEIRSVASLTAVPAALRRPPIGPQLQSDASASSTTSTPPPAGAEGSGGGEAEVVCVTGVRVSRSPLAAAGPAAPLMQQARDAQSASLTVLRQLYGTTAEDVIEVAQTNPRSGALEPPRMQYHLAQELLPELASPAAQLKAMHNARRRVDWDVAIPTAATLPPPAITFTTASGAPVATLTAVMFTVDTNTLVLQRDFAAEKALHSPSSHSRPSLSLDVPGAALSAALSRPGSGAANNSASFLHHTNPHCMEAEKKVGLEVAREDRVGSSGLFRIRRLLALRQGLGELVGLERVLEYAVTTAAPELFLAPPFVDASSGDLCMELNTSLQGTAKLTIVGVDCGSVDEETGSVQRSSNTLTCYVTLQHSVGGGSAAAANGAAVRGRQLASAAPSAGAVEYDCVPSQRLAATRSPDSPAHGRGSLPFAGSPSRDSQTADPHGSGAFALSLAHFSQEEAAGADGSRPSLSPERPARAATPTGDRGQLRPFPRRYSLDVQSVMARTAAEGLSSPAAISGAFTSGSRSAAASRRARTSLSSREAAGGAAGGDGDGPHFHFPLTNPHTLRYRHCTEAIRTCLVRQYTAQQQQQEAAEKAAAAQRRHDMEEEQDDNADEEHQQQPSKVRGSAVPLGHLVHTGNSAATHAAKRSPSLRNAHAEEEAAAAKWSDEDDDEDDKDKDVSNASSEGAASTGQSPREKKKRPRRKSVVEILELEEEFDRNNPVAMMPTVTNVPGGGETGSYAAPHSGTTAGRRPTTSTTTTRHNAKAVPYAAAGPPSSGGTDATTRELRRPRMPNSLFFLDTIQSPVSFMRLTVWQDRLLLLFEEHDKELLRSDERARFKREARQELTEGSLAGMLASTFTWSTTAASSIGGRKPSMHGRRSSAVFSSRASYTAAAAAAASAGMSSANDSPRSGNTPFSTVTNRGGGEACSCEKPFAMIRRLVLCLALEEERSSVQLYTDTVSLCAYLCRSALLKTMALTRGTRDGLQQAAAAVLSAGSPLSPLNGIHAAHHFARGEGGNAALTAADRQSLRLLSETLELSMTVLLLIGAYGSAVEYAVQRVHALCLLEGDTTAVVNAAQRDLVELYLFYGDYDTAVTIAEDVVMLTEQLCTETPDAYEVAEADALCTLACVAAGRRHRIPHYMDRLELHVLPAEEGLNGTVSVPLPVLQAQLRLVLGFARTYMAHSAPATDAASALRHEQQQQSRHPSDLARDVVPLVREAVRLLRGDGDLQEMEQSFSVVFPSQSRHGSVADGGGGGNVPLSMRGRLASMASCSITTGPLPNLRSTNGADPNHAEATAKMMAAQKRLRWNLLSFAGALLVQSEEPQEGIEVMESTVRELVLGQHRYLERNHRATIAATLWVGLVLCKSWAQPTSTEDFASMLREVASRVVRVMGPLHPFSAAANLQYANVAHHSLNGRHGLSLAARSFSVLEKAVSGQSHYLFVGHYILGSMAESQQRWRLALEHLSAAYAVAQLNHFSTRDRLVLETRFLGALLSCPPNAVVEVNTAGLRAQVRLLLDTVRQRVGPHDEAVAEPLWNMAEVHYLLKQPASALECLQEAARLLDRRGVLQSAAAELLRPVDALRIDLANRTGPFRTSAAAAGATTVEQLVQRRDVLVHSSFTTTRHALRFATTLFMLAAVLESQGCAEAAVEKYEQCLAIFEALQLGETTLPAAHIMTAVAKVLYTAGNCGDALMWATRAERLLYTHCRKQWPLELQAAEKLVAIVEQRLYDQEGSYVVQSDTHGPDGLSQLL